MKTGRIKNAGKLLALARSIDPSETRAPREHASDEEAGKQRFAAIERPTLKFADIAGLDDVKEQVRLKMIYPFTHSEIAEKFGIKKGGFGSSGPR